MSTTDAFALSAGLTKLSFSLEFHLPPLQCNGLATPKYKMDIIVLISIITVEDELSGERTNYGQACEKVEFQFLAQLSQSQY